MMRTALALGIVVVLAAVSQAEEASPHRNAISFSVGIATGSDGGGRGGDFHGFANVGRGSTGGVLGGTLLRDLSDRVAFEASGSYLDRGGAHGVSAMGQLLVTLTDRGAAVPYLSAGGGVYHASSELVVTRQEIPDPRGPGRRPGEPAGSRTTTTTLRTSRSTDPALSLGGGVRLDLGPRFYARPDARFMMVMTDGRNQGFGLFTFNVGWRF